MSSKRNRRKRGFSQRDNNNLSLENLYHKDGATKYHDETKHMQLCSQVHKLIDLALSCDMNDPVLQGVWVYSVIPEQGGKSLLVQVAMPTGASVVEVLGALSAASSMLKREVASSIHRKKTPNLQFTVLPFAAIVNPGK